MTSAFKEIPTMDEFIQGLSQEELFEGIEVLEKNANNLLYKKYETEQQLAITPETQNIECRAGISQLESAYHTTCNLLQKYRNKYHSRILPISPSS